MHLDMKTAETILTARLGTIPDAAEIAWATIWLEACGYSGVKLLGEGSERFVAKGSNSFDVRLGKAGAEARGLRVGKNNRMFHGRLRWRIKPTLADRALIQRKGQGDEDGPMLALSGPRSPRRVRRRTCPRLHRCPHSSPQP